MIRTVTQPETKKMATSGEPRSRHPGPKPTDANSQPETSISPGGLIKHTRGLIKDLNKFNKNQTLSHGYLNASLLSANASQLQMVIQSGFPGPMSYVQLMLLLTSIVLQVVQGILLLRKYQINMETANDNDPSDDEKDSQRAHRYNNWAMVVSIIIMAVNILISTFGGSLVGEIKAKTA